MLVSHFLTIPVAYSAHLKGRQHLVHLNLALLGLPHVHWEALRHADSSTTITVLSKFPKEKYEHVEWCPACVLHVSAGAEILPVVSVYFLNVMVLLEIQMRSKMNVEVAAPLAPTRGNTTALHRRQIKALIVTRNPTWLP